MIQTEQATAINDSIPTIKEGLASLKGLSLEDFISKIAHDLVNFTIHLAIAITVFYVGKFVINKIFLLCGRIMARRKIDTSLATFVLSLLRIVLYFILIITVIGILGINTSSFLALFASAGVAIGMALSGTLQNFAGGVLILLLKPYKVGDYIEAQGFGGTVREIQIFHTVINTADNKSIIIPNGGLSTGSINNWSKEYLRRVSWNVSLAYGDDVAAARKTILEMLAEEDKLVVEDVTAKNPLVIAGIYTPVDRSPSVVLSELGDSAIVIQIRAWAKTSDYWSLFYSFNERLYTELPEKGFHFPFPQLDVHLNPTDGPVTEAANGQTE
ncbi:MAG: mechanosensitive ion channel [Paramuribaculum sp.]|nr:mechanosensitive ion channel [Paramuribaculum sp.]